jgi:hypothetical protein
VPEYSSLTIHKLAVIKDGCSLELGNGGLMLNIITPLQKFSKGGTTLSDVIQQRYQDLLQRDMSQALLKRIEDVFIGKKVNKFSFMKRGFPW